jgi:hypothetical protein
MSGLSEEIAKALRRLCSEVAGLRGEIIIQYT